MEKRSDRLPENLFWTQAENAEVVLRTGSAYTPIRALPPQADAEYMFASEPKNPEQLFLDSRAGLYMSPRVTKRFE
jgi:hypothetical protein